jgi:hypothetical protein
MDETAIMWNSFCLLGTSMTECPESRSRHVEFRQPCRLVGISQADESMVGDGHAISVAIQTLEHMLPATEGLVG